MAVSRAILFFTLITVMGSSSRSFGTVFEMAQKTLRKTFGMELVELRSRAEIHAEGNATAANEELDEARKATGVKKKSAPFPSLRFAEIPSTY